MDVLRLVLFCLVYLQVGCGFLLDGETDKVCSIMALQSNMSMSTLLEYESAMCNSVNDHFQNHNAELLIHKDSILHLVKDNTALQQTVQQQATDLKQQATEIADLKARLIKLEQASPQKPIHTIVAFSTLLRDNHGVVSEGFKIKFDDVLVNSGNGYDISTGMFIAPISGAYHFSMSMASPTLTHFFLMKNGQNVEYTFTGNDNTWESTSQSAVMELLQGDKVWVEADEPIHGYQAWIRPGHPDHRYLHTGFMGFLIH